MLSANMESLYWRKFIGKYFAYNENSEKYSILSNVPDKIKKSFELWAKDNPDAVE